MERAMRTVSCLSRRTSRFGSSVAPTKRGPETRYFVYLYFVYLYIARPPSTMSTWPVM